jgi:hypothetical protein
MASEEILDVEQYKLYEMDAGVALDRELHKLSKLNAEVQNLEE